MSLKYVSEPLDKQKHNRAAFSCGVEALDSFLKQLANQKSTRSVTATHVLCEIGSSDIVGYYTISSFTVDASRFPSELVRKLPRYGLVPAFLIGRLAVDARYQGRGVGGHVLVTALKHCKRLTQADIGAWAVVVDAKDEQAARFYEHYTFRRFADNALSLFLPMDEIPSS